MEVVLIISFHGKILDYSKPSVNTKVYNFAPEQE